MEEVSAEEEEVDLVALGDLEDFFEGVEGVVADCAVILFVAEVVIGGDEDSEARSDLRHF